MPDEPSQELVIALAGPMVNVVIAIGLYLGLGSLVGLGALEHLDDQQLSMASQLLAVNIILVVFNLVPAFSMDGGRALRALLAMRLDYLRATRIAASVGQGLAFVFGFIGLFAHPFLIFIALFVYLGAGQEAASTQFRELARGMSVEEAMSRSVQPLSDDATLGEAADAVVQSPESIFAVVDGDHRPIGVLTRS